MSPKHQKKTILCCFLALTVLFSFNSCKKDNIETVYPNSYYPVYPGSQWNYLDSNGDVFKVSVNPKYQLHTINSVTKYVPLVSNTGFIYEYNYIEDGYKRGLLSEELNEVLLYSSGSSEFPFGWYRRISAVDTTIVIEGFSYYPTIEVERYVYDILWSKSYYTKDVGLIKAVRCFSGCDSTVTELKLVNYYINN